MTPGRELDALVAEKVMGLELGRFGQGDWLEVITQKGEFRPVPPYSTDIAAAWEVATRCKISVVRKGQNWVAGRFDDDDGAYFEDKGGDHRIDGWLYLSAVAVTAPHAICLAALKASIK